MSFEAALRLVELLVGFALMQQAAEHLVAARAERIIAAIRIALCLLLWSGWANSLAVLGLCGTSVAFLLRFNGPYNGGSDKMAVLILACLSLVHLAPSRALQELALAYLAAQLVLSYFVSGWIKVIKSDWRQGDALRDVFAYSAYPVSTDLRGWADRPSALRAASWAVMGFELIFPLLLLHPLSLAAGLLVAAAFHLSNACFFGLNRFFWIWISAYPALLWFQGRIIGGSIFG